MSRTEMSYFGLRMSAEGEPKFCKEQTETFFNYIREDSEIINETGGDLCQTAPVIQSAPAGMDWDVVAIYDDAGIPSIMHRFKRMNNAELFEGGSDAVHPAFIIGGEVYDEIYISVYPNTIINGKPYSLPLMEPATNIAMEDFAAACFSKGDGWHCMTAAEWGLLANISAKLGTLPHGNTDCGKWHADSKEKGAVVDGGYGKTLTGSGPATWTHDHSPTGVHDLCGNVWEFCRGCRIMNGAIQAAQNNDAALPETDLSENGKDWRSVINDAGKPVYGGVEEDNVVITTGGHEQGYTGCRWGDVKVRCESEQLKALALYPGEKESYCWMDSTDGEYCLLRGGSWHRGANAGVFGSSLRYPRSCVYTNVGGRSAFFVKH